MMKLTVTLIDNGDPREAIPVRALPFITGWNFSPDAIANAFSQTDEARRMRGVRSSRIRENSLTHIAPVDWEHVKVAMDGLDDKLPRGSGGYADWRGESIKLLPAGVFVWLDEFSMAFNSDFSPSNWLPDSRGEYPVLNLDPMLPEDMTTIICEGFPHHRARKEDCPIPSQSESIAETPEMPYAPDSNAIIASLAPEEATPYIDSERGCRRLILEHWKTIKELHGGSPDARHVFRFINRNLDPDQKPFALKTVRNRLRDLQREKKIP